VFAGGFIGVIPRAALAQDLPARVGEWPWPTFAVNVAGALLLGLVIAHAARPTMSRYRRSLLASGLCGALTTFSAMMAELLGMLRHGHPALACAYASASVLCGLAAVHVGTRAAGRVAGAK